LAIARGRGLAVARGESRLVESDMARRLRFYGEPRNES
jgi:hypothetical protein